MPGGVKTFNVHENYLIFPQTHAHRQKAKIFPVVSERIFLSAAADHEDGDDDDFLATLFSFLLCSYFGCFQVNHSLLCIECRALILAILFHIL